MRSPRWNTNSPAPTSMPFRPSAGISPERACTSSETSHDRHRLPPLRQAPPLGTPVRPLRRPGAMTHAERTLLLQLAASICDLANDGVLHLADLAAIREQIQAIADEQPDPAP